MPLFGFCSSSTGILSFCLSPHIHTHTLKTLHHPTSQNKSIAVSTFGKKLTKAMIDWIFNLKYSWKSWCVMFSLHIGMLRLPPRHCSQILTLQGQSTFSASIFTLKRLPEISCSTNKQSTAKLLNRALYKTNFISSDYSGRYRFVLCLNKWKSINVVYGLLLRTSFSILSAANILFC